MITTEVSFPLMAMDVIPAPLIALKAYSGISLPPDSRIEHKLRTNLVQLMSARAAAQTHPSFRRKDSKVSVIRSARHVACARF